MPDWMQGVILDIQEAYRGIPVWLQHKVHLVIKLNGGFWIEHNMIFGLVTAG
jgi:hypothetical protein